MDKESLELTNGIGHAVIKLRGLYSAWSGIHGISYHGMIVLCTIREHGFCTQKRVCESYRLRFQCRAVRREHLDKGSAIRRRHEEGIPQVAG